MLECCAVCGCAVEVELGTRLPVPEMQEVHAWMRCARCTYVLVCCCRWIWTGTKRVQMLWRVCAFIKTIYERLHFGKGISVSVLTFSFHISVYFFISCAACFALVCAFAIIRGALLLQFFLVLLLFRLSRCWLLAACVRESWEHAEMYFHVIRWIPIPHE